MRVLIDTQIFVWLDSEPEKLSEQAKSVLEEPENQLYLSVVSIWELQIKSQLGKLALERPLKSILESHWKKNRRRWGYRIRWKSKLFVAKSKTNFKMYIFIGKLF